MKSLNVYFFKCPPKTQHWFSAETLVVWFFGIMWSVLSLRSLLICAALSFIGCVFLKPADAASRTSRIWESHLLERLIILQAETLKPNPAHNRGARGRTDRPPCPPRSGSTPAEMRLVEHATAVTHRSVIVFSQHTLEHNHITLWIMQIVSGLIEMC